MNFLINEISILGLILLTQKSVWIIPIFFLCICFLLKLWMINHYNLYLVEHSQDIFSTLITSVYEKHLHKMDKIAFWGTLVLFFSLYRKKRSYIF